MVDYAMDIYRSLNNGEESKEMEENKKAVYAQLEDLKSRAEPLVALFASDEKASLVQEGKWNVRGIADSGITPDTVETYRQLAKFNYDCGDYTAARDMLNNYLSLFISAPDELYASSSFEGAGPDLLQVLWGRLSCEILLQNMDAASSALTIVRTVLESLASSHKISSLEALRQRTWLLHWSLFVFWNGTRKGIDQLLELYTSEKYLQAIAANASHLTRYLTAAVLMNKRRSGSQGSKMMRELLRVLQHCAECHNTQDPIVAFVESLCIKYDFEGAQLKFANCGTALKSDFFLCKQADTIMEEARIFIFENYCRIHSKLRVSELAEMLAMDSASAERWIVDLIRKSDLSAKIDLNENCVVMTGSASSRASVYQTVLDRTKDLNVRSSILVQNLNKGLAKERESKEMDYDD